MTDNKLEMDEAQRAANYEAIKSDVKHEVGNEIHLVSREPRVGIFILCIPDQSLDKMFTHRSFIRSV